MLPLLALLLAGSGCAALIYEIVWFQLLQLVIGSSGVSLGLLLAAYMGGLCLGSILLARYVPPAAVVDKPAYSAFFRSPLAGFLLERNVRTIIVSGAETDVCVLSTVLDAVDIGFRVVIVEDALCSSSDAGHDALMTMYRVRFSEQIDLVTAESLTEFWRP